MKKTLLIFSVIIMVSCVTKPKPADDIDWDYIFSDEDFADYCEEEPTNDCLYYPPYYYQ